MEQEASMVSGHCCCSIVSFYIHTAMGGIGLDALFE
jgi:hypothetical protein